MKLSKLRRIESKVILCFVMLTICTATISNVICYTRNNRALLKQMRQKVQILATSVSLLVDAEKHKEVTILKNANSQTYHDLISCLQEYETLMDITYVYTLVKTSENTAEFILDTDTEDTAEMGEPYELLDGMKLAFDGQVSSDAHITSDEWGSYISGYAPIKDSTGSVIAIVGVDIAAENIKKEQRMLLHTLSIQTEVSLLFVIVTSILLARTLVKPIRYLSENLKNLSTSGGDLTQKIEISTNDEIEELACSINDFIHNMSLIVQNVISKAEIINKQTCNLNTSICSINQCLSESSVGFQNLAEGATEQVKAVESINSRMQEIDMELIEDTKQMTLLDESIKDTEEHIGYGLDILKQLGERTELNVAAFQSVFSVVKALSDDMAAIKTLFVEVSDISEQVKLLALNATIESERAGAAGRGFSIIAAEINKLSERTSANTKEIATILTKINENTSKTDNELFVMNTALSQQVESVNRTEVIFKELSGIVTAMLDKLKVIDTSFKNASNSVDDSTRSITEVLSITQDTTAVTEELTASSIEQSDTMGKIKDAANELKELSEVLQEITAKFKV